MIAFPCLKCHATLHAPENKGGRQIKCPRCGGAVLVPTPGAADKYIGRRVRARQVGWEIPEDGMYTKLDFIDPPAWRDEGEPEVIEGVLTTRKGYMGKTVYCVKGVHGEKDVDPETVKPVDAAPAAEAPKPAAKCQAGQQTSSPEGLATPQQAGGEGRFPVVGSRLQRCRRVCRPASGTLPGVLLTNRKESAS